MIWPLALISTTLVMDASTVVLRSCMPEPDDQRKKCVAASPAIWLAPITWPASLMSIAWLVVPPSVPRSWMTPVALQRTACVAPGPAGLAPTTWPALLIASAPALDEGSPLGRMERAVVDAP